MNRRTAKVYRLHQSLGLVLPIDWTRGMGLESGDLVELTYNGSVHVRPLRQVATPDARGRNPGVPAAQPAKPVTHDGVIVSGTS